MFLGRLIPVSLLAFCVNAVASPGPTPAAIYERQSSGLPGINIPAQCQTECAVINVITNCSTSADNVTCVCSNDVGSELLSCVDCGVSLGGILQQQIQAVQSQLNSFVQGCDQAGESISPLSIGATPSPSSTSTPTPTSPSSAPLSGSSMSASASGVSATATAAGKNEALKAKRIPGGFIGIVVCVVLGIGIVMW